MWESLLLSHIGEQLRPTDVIGATRSLKVKERQIHVWLRDGSNEQTRTQVSNRIGQCLQLDPSVVTLYYKEHQKSIKDGSTMKNAEGFKFVNKQQPKFAFAKLAANE